MVYSANRFLSLEEMTVNGQYILDFLKSRGWSKNSVCGMLGNMETESTINPGIWQNLAANNMSMGFGLVQWTPATKYTDWADANGFQWENIDGQLHRLQYEIDNNLQWISTVDYPLSFQEFKVSTESPEYLAQAFLRNYERPADQTQPNRSTQARYWFDTLDGDTSTLIQLAQFPMDVINISQGENGSFSHQGTLAIDFVGKTDRYPYYAPCDCECIGRNDSEAILEWKSNNMVMCADGLARQIVWRCIHDDILDYGVGDKLLKGQLMGHTGNGGNSAGDHLHLDVWLGTTFTRTDPLHIYDVFAVNGVEIINGLGYSWKTSDWVDGGGGGGLPPVKSNNIYTLLMVDALNGWKF